MNTMDALGTEDAARWGYRTLMGQNRRGVVLTPEQQGAAAGQGAQASYDGDPTTVPTNGVPPPSAPPSSPGVPPPAPPGSLDKWGRAPGHPDYGRPPQTTPDNRGPAPGRPGPVPVPAPPPPPPAGTPATYGTTPRTDMGSGSGGGYAYTGFDFTQDANNRLIGKSAKYSFAEATKAAEAAGAGDVWKTKEGAQYFAEKYIAPKLQEAGFEVIDIKGDKMFVRDWEDRAAGRPGRWVDFVVNADGENPALAWQVDNAIDALGTTEKKYDPRADAGTSPYAPPPSDSGASAASSGIRNDAYERLAADRRSKRLSDIV